MRLVFFLLLLANVLFFGWTRIGPELAMSESFLLSQQINPDAIRLLDPKEVALLAAKKPLIPSHGRCGEAAPTQARRDQVAPTVIPDAPQGRQDQDSWRCIRKAPGVIAGCADDGRERR